MAAIVAPNIVTDGLVACWDAGNRKSYPGAGEVWTDVAAGNNAALQNYDEGDFSSDDMGYIALDGTDQYAEVPGAGMDFRDKMSLFVWVRFDNTEISGWTNKGKASEAQYGLEITGGGNFACGIYTGGWTGTSSSFYINAGRWLFLGFTYDRVNIKLYANGSLQAENAETDAISGDSTPFNIGAGSWGGSAPSWMDGDMAAVYAYNKGLTAAEVLQNYNATKRRFGL